MNLLALWAVRLFAVTSFILLMITCIEGIVKHFLGERSTEQDWILFGVIYLVFQSAREQMIELENKVAQRE
jgi:hypothetical protein